MGWKETCYMDERLSFVAGYLRGDEPMTMLCESHGISRKTGYKWLERYERGDWTPYTVLEHGDLWYGNFLLPGKAVPRPRKR